MRPAVLVPPHPRQFLPLLVGEIHRNITARLGKYVMHLSRCIFPNLLQFFCCLIEDRRDLGHLFWSQIELMAKPLPHVLGSQSPMCLHREEMPSHARG